MDYRKKYIKYKSKYLSLKNANFQLKVDNNQFGGGWEDATDFGKACNDSKSEKPKFPRDVDFSADWKINKYMISTKDILTFKNLKLGKTEDELKFEVIRKTFESDGDKPVLFVMAGISTNSLCGTAEVLVRNHESLRGKFKEIYIINNNSFKAYQDDACQTYRDVRKKALNKETILRTELTKEELNDIYDGEIRLAKEIAQMVHKIITEELKLTNVHVFGKCAGGEIALNLVCHSDIYKALYLAVPGSVRHITPLYDISPKRLESMHFIFGWNENDDYAFNWNGRSSTEKEVYDEEMGKLEAKKKIGINYESYMFRPGNKNPEGKDDGHQPPDKLFDKIAKSIN
jgi:hypothetical protein